jgi:hypothetical protein
MTGLDDATGRATPRDRPAVPTTPAECESLGLKVPDSWQPGDLLLLTAMAVKVKYEHSGDGTASLRVNTSRSTDPPPHTYPEPCPCSPTCWAEPRSVRSYYNVIQNVRAAMRRNIGKREGP